MKNIFGGFVFGRKYGFIKTVKTGYFRRKRYGSRRKRKKLRSRLNWRRKYILCEARRLLL